MATSYSPKIVTDGLVAAFDAANIKSFRGPVQTNLLTLLNYSLSNTNTSTFKITNGTELVNIPNVGTRTVKYVDVYNDFSGGSGQCCPSLYSFGDFTSGVSGNTTYTYSILYKTLTGYTHPNYMYRYEYNGGTYVTEAGVHSTSNRTHLGDGWYHAWGQFTTQASTTRLITFLFHYEYATHNRVYVAAVQLTPGTYIGSPQHMLDSAQVRGDTVATGGGVSDLSRNSRNGQLLNGTSFDNSNGGSFVFDGTNDSIDFSSNWSTTSTMSIETWVKLSLRGDRHIVVVNWTGWALEVGQSGSLLYPYFTWWNGSSQLNTQWNTAITPGSWNHIVCTFDGSTARIYINGSLSASYASTTISYGVYARQISGTVFSGPILGNVAMVNNYEIALTNEQILQNFNAHRTRFGI
jgi:hypothetical protein